MKLNNKLILFIIFLANLVSAQIPSGYYDSASGLSGEGLKTSLYNIIKDHTEFPYTYSGTDVWDILKETDKDPQNPNNVILLYTGWSVDAEQEWNNGNGWSREHVWSKSHGDFGTTQGAGTDVHHLRPSDPSVNSAKNNRWFDDCNEPYLDNDLYTGCFTSYDDWVWQPRDEVKGDVARMIFYMSTRYEGENDEPDLEILDYLPVDNNTSEPVYAMLLTLKQWHEADPVDDWELNRNNIIYYNYQNNRNPFIDHPEFVDLIWKDDVSVDLNNETKFNIYPCPTSDHFVIDVENLKKVEVIDFQGKILFIGNANVISVSDCPNGLYLVKVTTTKCVLLGEIVVE